MKQSDPRLAVCLSFDFDALSNWIGYFKSNDPALISRGEFGAVAIDRILKLLQSHDIRATFFVPGHTACAYPELVRRIVAEGHEVGHHGWVHENPALLELDEERVVIERGLEALEGVTDMRPNGYRSPGAAFSPNTIDLLLQYGFRYDSSCSGSDFHPYYLRQGDRWSTTEPYVFGKSSELLELPFAWSLDDWPLFEFAAPFSTNIYPPSLVREIWQGEFDFAYSECAGGVYTLCMHPQVIGRGHRLAMLDGLIEYMKGRNSVRFETMGEYAERWRCDHPLEAWVEDDPLHARQMAATFRL